MTVNICSYIQLLRNSFDQKDAELKEALEVIKKNNALSNSLAPLIEKEINDLQNKMNMHEEKRYEMFVSTAKYVFNSPMKSFHW